VVPATGTWIGNVVLVVEVVEVVELVELVVEDRVEEVAALELEGP